nr:MAG TPA: hypothetical protein [Caudoviricetes sp.]
MLSRILSRKRTDIVFKPFYRLFLASSNLVTSIFYWKFLSTFLNLKPLRIGLETCFFHVFSYAFPCCVIFPKR